MKALLITLIVCTGILGQTREDLKRKYGGPTSETFRVRPNVAATATYTASGDIVEILISPNVGSEAKSRNVILSPKLVADVVDELLPKSKRGKYLIGSFLNLACLPANDCAGSMENYENARIYRNSGPGGIAYCVIHLKK